MSDYTQVIDYSAKDALSSGDPNKKIKGSDVDQDFAAIATAIATKVDKTGATMTGQLVFTAGGIAMADTVLSRPAITDYGVTHTAPASSSGAITFDLTNGNSFKVTLTENITSITLSNPPASGTYGEIVIEFIQDGTGSRTVSGWPAAVKWQGGTGAPTITTTASTGRDKIFLSTNDGGTTWLGEFSQNYS